jgi:prepilin-type processing-associated H-X9-DG protein
MGHPGGVDLPGWKPYHRLTEIPTPSTRFAFIDVHPDWIGDAAYFVNPQHDSPWGFTRYPSPLHQGGATLSFADGHAEKKRWILADSRRPVIFAREAQGMDQKKDYLWLLQRTGERRL